MRASPASTIPAWNLPPKWEHLFPAKRGSTTHRDEAKIFGKFTEVALESNVCIHSRLVPDASQQWCAWQWQQWRCIHGPWASHSAALLQGLPAPQTAATNPISEWDRSKGGCQVPLSCREKISCPLFHGCLHALDVDLQPGCPCQGLPCHWRWLWSRGIGTGLLPFSPLLSSNTSVQLRPSWTLGWLTLVPTRPLYTQAFKWTQTSRSISSKIQSTLKSKWTNPFFIKEVMDKDYGEGKKEEQTPLSSAAACKTTQTIFLYSGSQGGRSK